MSYGIIGGASLAAAILAVGLLFSGWRWDLPRLTHPDRATLRDAGWNVTLGQWEGVRALLIAVGVVIGSTAGTPAVAAAILCLAPSIAARARAGAVRDRARRSLAPLLIAAYASLRSGVALPEALRRAVASCEDKIARRPFEEALARFDLGDPLDVALGFGAMRTKDQRVSESMRTLALGVSERMPVDRAASLLNAVAELVRHDEGLEREVHARSAGIRIQLYVLAAIVPVLALYLLATMPGLATTLDSGLGRAVLVPTAALLEVTGIVMSRRIIQTVSR